MGFVPDFRKFVKMCPFRPTDLQTFIFRSISMRFWITIHKIVSLSVSMPTSEYPEGVSYRSPGSSEAPPWGRCPICFPTLKGFNKNPCGSAFRRTSPTKLSEDCLRPTRRCPRCSCFSTERDGRGHRRASPYATLSGYGERVRPLPPGWRSALPWAAIRNHFGVLADAKPDNTHRPTSDAGTKIRWFFGMLSAKFSSPPADDKRDGIFISFGGHFLLHFVIQIGSHHIETARFRFDEPITG